MKLLSFHYHLKFEMDAPVHNHRFTLRCTPQSNACQKILQLQHYVFPSDFLRESRDQWGNILQYGVCRQSHTSFEANVCGQAVAGISYALPAGNPELERLFGFSTVLTSADAEIREFAEQWRLPVGDALEQATFVMQSVHSRMRYVPGSTTVATTAAQAFQLGCGVCQDYSHVMLAVLRAQGIPARYVVGMLEGEGKSHAWVEVLCKSNWYGLDPTNCVAVNDCHIKMSHGRDARDCEINRGVFRGFANQNTDISVIVTEVS